MNGSASARPRRSGKPRPGSGPNRRKPPPRKAPETARSVALRALRRVTEQGSYSNLTLAGELARSGLDERDRHLAAELLYGTLRHLVPVDRAIRSVSTRSLRSIDIPALAVLRLGAYQLLYLRIPEHAAVSETVSLAGQRERGFVNAVLRNLIRRPPSPAEGHDDAAISARTGLAEWAVGELRRVLPAEEVEPAAAGLASQTDLSLRVNTCANTMDRVEAAFRDAGFDPVRGAHLPDDVLKVRTGTPAALPGYADGWFAVQDEASVLVAAAVQAQPGERILDACAAPGGKAAFLACAVGPEGRVVAADVRPARTALVRQSAGRLGVRLDTMAMDGARPAVRGGFDAVLVDAPCSGFGAARRRPELLWRPAKEDLAQLARLQASILTGVAPLVRPGGRMVYSVCTFPRAETDAVLRAFAARCPEFESADVPGPDGPAPVHRLWPHRHGTDGMFYAGFVRR
ncbi:MAG TPA: 16S rRNA (cytosine(967)-C(5))-methyltransferase RsmB [Actinobacteria bacterium]|nr:16S rRNA (cytosine(967)-C(5))-methyltransferase RsmB [Actinomycetota bacterium]